MLGVCPDFSEGMYSALGHITQRCTHDCNHFHGIYPDRLMWFGNTIVSTATHGNLHQLGGLSKNEEIYCPGFIKDRHYMRLQKLNEI